MGVVSLRRAGFELFGLNGCTDVVFRLLAGGGVGDGEGVFVLGLFRDGTATAFFLIANMLWRS